MALTLLFGDETEVSVLDLEAVRKHGWDVAGPEAYPLIFRKERGMTIRPPSAWELELMEGCLRAIPAFISGMSPLLPPASRTMSDYQSQILTSALPLE